MADGQVYVIARWAFLILLAVLVILDIVVVAHLIRFWDYYSGGEQTTIIIWAAFAFLIHGLGLMGK